MSGAIFNPAVCFALWLTKKLSNRKFILYILVELLGSVFAMTVMYATFTSPTKELYAAIAVVPSSTADIYRVFATEFFATFILTYVAFNCAYEDAER